MKALIKDLCVYFSKASHIYTEKSVEVVLCMFRENRKRKYVKDITCSSIHIYENNVDI